MRWRVEADGDRWFAINDGARRGPYDTRDLAQQMVDALNGANDWHMPR